MSATAVATALKNVLKHPVAKYYKYNIISYNESNVVAKAHISDARKTSKYEIHSVNGGAYYLLDLTSYIAALMQIGEGQTATTQSINCNVLGTIPLGAEVVIQANVTPSRHLDHILHLNATISLNDKILVTGTIVRSIEIEQSSPLVVNSAVQSPSEQDSK